jgi:hypothetical protein
LGVLLLLLLLLFLLYFAPILVKHNCWWSKRDQKV